MMYVGCYLSHELEEEYLNLNVNLGNRTEENSTCGSETESLEMGLIKW